MTTQARATDLLRSMLGVGGAAAVGHLLMLLAMPLISRLYSTEDFGRFGLFFGLTNTLSILSAFGLQDSLFAIPDDYEAKAVFKSCIALALLSVVPLMVVAFVLIGFDLFGYGSLAPWSAVLVSICSAAIAIGMTAQVALVRSIKFRQLAVGHIVLGVSKPLLQTAGGTVGLGFAGLAIAETGTRLLTAAILVRNALASFGNTETASLQTSNAFAWRQRRFVMFRTPSVLLFAMGTALPAILIADAFGLSAAGTYTLMFSVIAGPLGLIQKAVGDVFLGHFNQRLRKDVRSARQFLISTALFLLLCSIIPAAILASSGPSLFSFLFGEAWRSAGELAQAMTPVFIADMVVGPLGGVLNALNSPGRKIYFDSARVLGLVGSYLIVVGSPYDLRTMVTLMTVFGIVSYAIYLVLILTAFRNTGSTHARPDSPSTANSRLP